MSTLPVLFLLAVVLCVGCSEFMEDETGIVWVKYGLYLSDQTYAYVKDDVPVKIVNDFLVARGHTPRVLETHYNISGQAIEVIYLGSEIDPSSLFGGLRLLPGVIWVEREMSTKGLFKDPPEEKGFTQVEVH